MLENIAFIGAYLFLALLAFLFLGDVLTGFLYFFNMEKSARKVSNFMSKVRYYLTILSRGKNDTQK